MGLSLSLLHFLLDNFRQVTYMFLNVYNLYLAAFVKGIFING